MHMYTKAPIEQKCRAVAAILKLVPDSGYYIIPSQSIGDQMAAITLQGSPDKRIDIICLYSSNLSYFQFAPFHESG